MTTEYVFRKGNQETVLGVKYFQRPGDRFGFQWSFMPDNAMRMQERLADGVVVDEYGEEYTPELFWDMVTRWHWNVDYVNGKSWNNCTKTVEATEEVDDRQFVM